MLYITANSGMLEKARFHPKGTYSLKYLPESEVPGEMASHKMVERYCGSRRDIFKYFTVLVTWQSWSPPHWPLGSLILSFFSFSKPGIVTSHLLSLMVASQ